MGQPIVHFEIIGKIRRSCGASMATCSNGGSIRAPRSRRRSLSRGTTASWTATPPATGSGSLAASAEVLATSATRSSTSAFPTSRPRSRRPRASAGRALWPRQEPRGGPRGRPLHRPRGALDRPRRAGVAVARDVTRRFPPWCHRWGGTLAGGCGRGRPSACDQGLVR